ncbi:amidohydrolase family protein, partial [uncultured Muribaculum sp.]
MSTLRIIHANILTPKGRKALHGKAMNELHHIPDGEITIVDGTIDYVGHVRENIDITAIDAQGRVVLPGFVDSHTHLVFGGFRPEEFMWRMRGDSYMSIMERGG